MHSPLRRGGHWRPYALRIDVVLCVRALEQSLNEAAALEGCLWAVLELTLVRGEKQKPGNGAGTVKKVAMVEFYW